MIVYITTNLLNGKKYIGKDVANNPNYLGSGKAFRRALQKYGRQNFVKQVLAEAINKQDSEDLEIYYIDYYNAQKSSLFYNITRGGSGGNTGDQSHKKVKIYQFDINGIFIKDWDSAADASKALGIGRSKIVTSCNSTKSYKRYLWSYKPILDSIPKNLKFNKPILQFDKQGNFIKEWDCLIDIEKELGFDRANIQSTCKRKGSVYGFKWTYK